jgi:parvulin-like peptidyl-prolyl isomerase
LLEQALQSSGITEGKFRSEIKFILRIKRVAIAQNPDTKAPSDKEIEDYYAANKKEFEVPGTVHARHVLMKSDEKDDQKTKLAKKAKAEDLEKKLTAGGDPLLQRFERTFLKSINPFSISVRMSCTLSRLPTSTPSYP